MTIEFVQEVQFTVHAIESYGGDLKPMISSLLDWNDCPNGR